MNRFDTIEQVQASQPVRAGDGQSVSSNISQDTQSRDAYSDYRKMHYKNTIPDNRVLVFLTGFCVGMVFFYLTGGKDVGAGNVLDSDHLALLQNFEVNRTGLFSYVIGLRLKQLVLGMICSFSTVGALLAYSIMGWWGFEVGLLIFSLVYQYSIKGILLTFAMLLPHTIFYAIIFLVLFRRYWGSDKKCCHNEATIKNQGQHPRWESIKTIVLILLMFCAGVLCEVYVNPLIMSKVALLF